MNRDLVYASCPEPYKTARIFLGGTVVSDAQAQPRPVGFRVSAAAGVVAIGIVAEALGPASSPALTAADFAVGTTIGCFGAWLVPRSLTPALLALAFAVTWFLGTLSVASSSVLSGLGSVLLLAHRGPLLQLLLGMPTGRLAGRRVRALAAGGWIAAVLPLAIARPATTIAAALVSAVLAARSRRSAGQRRVLLLGAAAAAGLAVVWALAVVGGGNASVLLAVDDLLVLGAGCVALSSAAGAWNLGAASRLVVELGSARHAGRPVSAQLAKILADPALEVRYRVPGFGWVDEKGHPSEPPDRGGRAITRATAPGGGEAALVHGDAGSGDQRLVAAAAAAAALVLDAARLEADVRAHAAEVRASRGRLLTVADAERRSLGERLVGQVLAPLRGVEGLLRSRPDAAGLVGELRDAIAEIVALGRGVYPPALARADLSAALAELADRCPASTTVEISGQVDHIPERLREAAWFVCAEALANVARHAGASRACVGAVVGEGTVEVEVRDDGRGGATVERGLRGLKDRVEALGGTLAVDSPQGGPTVVRAELPLSNQGPPPYPSREIQGSPR
jgi:signal transduction histidine kinase